MPLPALPNVWNVYNLRGSPFFQDTLHQGHDSLSLELFVGREHEVGQLRSYIAARDSSRLAVAGPVGVGKTTLVQRLKAAAIEDGYFTSDDLVPFIKGDTPEALFGRVLSGVYTTILTNRPQSGDNPAMQAAQQLVRASRLHTGGASLSLGGFGGGMTKGVTTITPKDILYDGPRILAELIAMVRHADARGLVLHLNNLETLAENDLTRAADLLLSLRDPMLMIDGLHVIVVGTTEAVATVINTNPQVRNVFRIPLVLQPLSLPDVHALLCARYDAWRADVSAPARPPVEAAVIDRLHTAFQGDLRGLLKALDDGVEDCIGLDMSGTPTTPHTATVPPVGLASISASLSSRYAGAMQTELESGRLEQMLSWLRSEPHSTRTQRDLAKLWHISQGAVSMALSELTAKGYVRALPRDGKSAINYTLAGKSRIIAGIS